MHGQNHIKFINGRFEIKEIISKICQQLKVNHRSCTVLHVSPSETLQTLLMSIWITALIFPCRLSIWTWLRNA